MEENNNNYEESTNEQEQNEQNENNTQEDSGINQITDESSVKLLSAIGYIWILFILPLCLCKDNKFAKFHTNQALLLFLAETIYGVVFGVLGAVLAFIPILGTIFGIITLVGEILLLIVAILQIIAACNMEEKEVPVIGKIRIIK